MFTQNEMYVVDSAAGRKDRSIDCISAEIYSVCAASYLVICNLARDS